MTGGGAAPSPAPDDVLALEYERMRSAPADASCIPAGVPGYTVVLRRGIWEWVQSRMQGATSCADESLPHGMTDAAFPSTTGPLPHDVPGATAAGNATALPHIAAGLVPLLADALLQRCRQENA